MAPRLLHYIRKIFRTRWRAHVAYGPTSLTRRRRNTCVLKSVSSKSSLSGGSSSSSSSNCEAPVYSCSMDSINFEFRNPEDDLPDLCCARKCCKKCFCAEGEAMAENLRKSQLGSKRWKKLCNDCTSVEVCAKKKCYCSNIENQTCCKKCCCPSGSRGSLDSACDISSASSCDGSGVEPRSLGSVGVRDFVSLQAAALSDTDSDSLTHKYENVPPPVDGAVEDAATYDNANIPVDRDVVVLQKSAAVEEESPYDFVPPRTPRAVVEPKYENVLTVNCVDECVFREISAMMESTKTHSQVVESLHELHKNYSCIRRNSSADNEINYFYEDYEELENDLNTELERRLSD